MIIHNCEQGSTQWHDLRSGKPTSSNASNLVTSSGKPSDGLHDYALTLAAEKYAGKAVDVFGGNRYTARGKILEDESRTNYEMTYQVEVEQTGFITDNLMRYGFSPDGLINKDGGFETKCTMAKEHIRVLLYYRATGKTPTEYVAQPKMCLYISGREWWDLYFYHPDLPALCIRQYPDKNFFKVLKNQLSLVAIERDEILAKLKSM